MIYVLKKGGSREISRGIRYEIVTLPTDEEIEYMFQVNLIEKGMIINMRKWLSITAMLISITLIGVAVSQSMRAYNLPIIGKKTMAAIPYEENFSNIMLGENGSVLLVDSISDKEYTEMMNILYPNGIVDTQGQDIPGINNFDEARAKFIAEHMKAYSLVGEKTIEVKLTTFKINITDKSNGEYESIFYKASIGKDNFVFPSEWGNQSYGFISVSEKNIYIAYTDMGIWHIDPENMSAKKISSDKYSGKTQAEISLEIKKLHPDWYLTWIDSVNISPDGNYVVYRTNRDSTALNETSVWEIDLKNGEERQLIQPSYNNDIVGFITNRNVVVGALSDTRMVDVINKTVIPVNVPKLPNLRITGVKDGKITYSSYEDGSFSTTVFISSVNVSTGELSEIAKVVGYLDGEPHFSPSGNKIAIGYGADPMVGVTDVMIIDMATMSRTLLTDLLQNPRALNGNVIHFRWINDDEALVDLQRGLESSSFLIKYQGE
ncbi:MAG: hypothetical protein BSOLF_2219 [Candidatus Carbobacillus altaicus]|uniref:Uncharacterized protein n=1 Tax=Candidatus Carbonibacillus altaicus TaxID=2163959 RepID=A0A2R6Y329_9BACL|nr:MAG: hypothetical protein BSOLF_2219 [Candidatus Carbobacillus altaicus]